MAENRKQNPKPPPDDEAQSKRFIEDAKQLEVDETGELFEKAFGIVSRGVMISGQLIIGKFR